MKSSDEELSTEALMVGCYRQVFGFKVYEGQGDAAGESSLAKGEITVKEFVRTLAKSDTFPRHVLDSLLRSQGSRVHSPSPLGSSYLRA